MASDYFVAAFFVPVAAIAIILLGAAAYLTRRAPRTNDSSIRWQNIVQGYFGATFATAACATFETIILGFNKVQLGHIHSSELLAWIPPSSIYMSVLLLPFVLVIMTFLGLPLFLLFRKLGFASVSGTVVIAFILAGIVTTYLEAKANYIGRCEIHPFRCALEHYLSALPLTAVIALSFAGAARLPLFRNTENAT